MTKYINKYTPTTVHGPYFPFSRGYISLMQIKGFIIIILRTKVIAFMADTFATLRHYLSILFLINLYSLCNRHPNSTAFHISCKSFRILRDRLDEHGSR